MGGEGLARKEAAPVLIIGITIVIAIVLVLAVVRLMDSGEGAGKQCRRTPRRSPPVQLACDAIQ